MSAILLSIVALFALAGQAMALTPIFAGPDDPQATFEQATAYKDLGDNRRAFDMFISIFNSYPEHDLADDSLLEAIRLAERMKSKRVNELKCTYLDHYPATFTARTLRKELFRSYSSTRDFKGAAELYPDIVRYEPSSQWLDQGAKLIDQLSAADAPEESLKLINVVYSKGQGQNKGKLLLAWNAALGQCEDQTRLRRILSSVQSPDLANPLKARIDSLGKPSHKSPEAAAQTAQPAKPAIAAETRPAAPKAEPALKAAIPGKNAIGLLLPLTGKWSSVGQKILKGVQQAQAAAGSEGLPTLVVKDYASEDARIPALIGELDDEGVMAVIGPLGEKSCELASISLQQRGIPGLLLTKAEQKPQPASQTFDALVSVDAEAKTLLKTASAMGIKRFAILQPDDHYGQSFASAFETYARQYGVEIVKKVVYTGKKPDFKAEVGKLLAGSPKAGASFQGLMVPDSPAEAAQIATYLNYARATNVRLFGPSLWDHPDLVKIGSRAVENAVFVSGFYRQSVNPNVVEFNDRYYYAYNENPTQWDATGYDAAMILQKLMVGQRRNRATLRDGLLSLEYPGLTGSVSFRSDGTAKRTIYTLTVQGGRIVEISPSAAAIAPTE